MFTFYFIFIAFTAGWLALEAFSRVPKSATLTALQAADRLAADPKIQLVDVRTEMEYKGGHLRGAMNIPLQSIGSRVAEIDKARPLIVYCRSGHRSGLAMQSLLKKGLNASHIEGGILAWKAENMPVER